MASNHQWKLVKMAKIIYGVSGEGSGHSSRARLIASHLIAKNHSVKIVSYDRGYRNLKDDFDCLEIVGLSIVSVDNEVSKLKTISANLAKIPQGRSALSKLRHLFRDFSPDCVITDFEPCTAYLANHYDLPLISLDNQHRMRYMKYERPQDLQKEAALTEIIIKAMVPRPWVSLITSFHSGELKNNRSFIFPPILRQSILALSPATKDHILVYVTSAFESLISVLQNFPHETFFVYGYDRDDTVGNIVYKPFSPVDFPKNLSSAKAVVATAGFTLISEALYLGKPYLAFPMQGQFEQHLNAHMLELLGYGAEGHVADEATLAAFLYKLPDYARRLEKYPRQGNQEIQHKLDRLLENEMAELLKYRR